MKLHLYRIGAIALAAFLSFSTAEAQQRSRDDWRPDNRTEWEALGAAEIGTRLEQDVIPVGRREGRFRSIGFTVTGNDVRIEDLTIVYGGGERDTLQVREVLKNGTRSRPIDLPGRAQFIERIEVTYRSPGPVRIEFFGEKRREPTWTELGCHSVRFLEPNDIVRVGRREGAFNAIKLQVSGATLRLQKMRVVFGDGSSQVFDIRSAIPAGTETQPLDLDGRRRVIDRIELDYIPSLRLKGGPRVCVSAIEGGGPRWREEGPRGGDRGPPRSGREWDRDRR